MTDFNKKISRLKRLLFKTLGRRATNADTAAALGISDRQLYRILIGDQEPTRTLEILVTLLTNWKD